MIKVYTGLKGFAVSLFFIAGMVLVLSIFLWGVTKTIELLLPFLIVIAYLLIFIFIFVFLPATFFSKDLRPTLCFYSVWMSHALGVAAWMMSFFYVIQSFGLAGVFLIFLFQFLGPVALVAAILKGSWHIAAHLALWIGFIYGMRFYSQWLLNYAPRDPKEKDIIDVDAQVIRPTEP